MHVSFNSRGSSTVLGSGQRLKDPLHDYRLLSNLYGDVEFGYMADRFQNRPVAALFTTPGSDLRNPGKFEENFRAVHPTGKPASWMRAPSGGHQAADDAAGETALAMGILAKLCGNAYKPTREGRRRRAHLIKLAKMDESDWAPMKGELTAYEKASLMLPLLRRKFTPPGLFRQTLEGSGDAQLIERPMRGGPRLWEGVLRDGAVVGGNLCGRLLMYVRGTLDQPTVAEDDRRALTRLVAEAEAAVPAGAPPARKGTQRAPKPRKSPAANRTRRRTPAKPAAEEGTGTATKPSPKRTTQSRKSPKPPAATRTRRRERAKAKVEAFLAEVRAAEKAQAGKVDVGRMKVVELRAALKARGLSTKGLKKELVSRLESALS